MKYAINHLSVVAVHVEASEHSEVCTEILFGEFFKVLEHRAAWSRIRLFDDKSEGWIKNNQYTEINAEKYDDLSKDTPVFCAQSVGICRCEEKQQPILIGSRLPLFHDTFFQISDNQYSFDGYVANGKKSKSDIARVAKGFLNAPYRSGGRSFFGIDSSALVQLCYRLCGRKLARTASEQATGGEVLSFVEEAEEGDLAFFDNEEGIINHVGILLNDHRIIHSYGCVRIDQIDQTGIFNADEGKYTHRLRLLKKM